MFVLCVSLCVCAFGLCVCVCVYVCVPHVLYTTPMQRDQILQKQVLVGLLLYVASKNQREKHPLYPENTFYI